jgi:hypothetical protein
MTMARTSRRELARAVLSRYPRTFGEELGLRSLDTPSPLFRLLVIAVLMSARIRASIALDARKRRRRAHERTPRFIASALLIDHRPSAADERSRVGDWEAT